MSFTDTDADDADIETGNMLIMMYAHARVSGDGTLLAQHVRTAPRVHRPPKSQSSLFIVQPHETVGRLLGQQFSDVRQPVRLVFLFVLVGSA